jgi:hypothetical protein
MNDEAYAAFLCVNMCYDMNSRMQAAHSKPTAEVGKMAPICWFQDAPVHKLVC